MTAAVRLVARKVKRWPSGPITVAEYQRRVAAEKLEHPLQVEVANWLDVVLDPRVAWTAVDHAAKVTPRQGADRKRRGVKPGQADFRFILVGGRSAEIEMKRLENGEQSDPQIEWQRRVELAGGLYAIARSIGEVRAVLVGWGVELREIRTT